MTSTTRFESGINILVEIREELWQKLKLENSSPITNQVKIQETASLLRNIQDALYFLTPRTAREEAMDSFVELEESLGLRSLDE